jgi:AraC family transcriptional regulator of adaptative response/methylated-DNA-[protein]-cysteine methyltransferase
MTQNTPSDAYHYQVIRRALDVIDAEGPGLRLDDLAARIGLSPAHVQRVFSHWVGVSPKRYQQYLALDHAKHLLKNRFTVLDTTQTVGLSSPGRLHDLFITWEAMTPGDYAKGGKGHVIRWGRFDTPFGQAVIAATYHGICGIGFAAEIGIDAARDDLQSRWPKADFIHDAPALRQNVDHLFDMASAPHLHLIGAPFQIKVWEALLAIPSGHVTTYSEIAKTIGNPNAVRAVGTAIGRNPIAWLIPCHRALRKSGGLGGYHWGLPIKRAMLAWETAKTDHDFT